MFGWEAYLWQFPYFRWHFFFTFLPIVIVWSLYWRYLYIYKKTVLYAVAVSLLYGIPADFLAVNIFHVWNYVGTAQFGPFVFGLPVGEYLFIFFFPLEFVPILLLIRRFLYKN